jgi:ESS family glutamate:Na+ symporter
LRVISKQGSPNDEGNRVKEEHSKKRGKKKKEEKKRKGVVSVAIELNMYRAVALAAFLYWLGTLIVSKVSFFSRYCIPSPLVGGLCFAILNTILYSAGLPYITFDSTFQTLFMNMFFTTVGFTVSIPLLLRGGKAVLIVLILASILILLQNGLGAVIMKAFGQDPRLGLAVGSISMVGGPGTAAAFGPVLEEAGAEGGSVVGLAAATFGLIMGSLMGGPVAKMLITKHNLTSSGGDEAMESDDSTFTTHSGNIVKGFMLVMLCVGIGNWVSVVLTSVTGLTFPSYIGAMLVAVVVRNVMLYGKMDFPGNEIDSMGNMCLCLFLAMALMSLKLWQLVGLALPMIIALAAQIVLMFLYAYFICFPMLGRNYDAAVEVSGLIGFGMGATSNAMANMQAVTKKYGPSPTAFFAIPIVGGMFIDFINSVCITFGVTFFGNWL